MNNFDWNMQAHNAVNEMDRDQPRLSGPTITFMTGAEWQREQIKKLLANHPDPRCDEHPDDDQISCGWKRAYTDLLNYMED